VSKPNPEESIFAAARQLPPEDRAAYLAQATEGDATLRRRIEALLNASEQSGAFLEVSAAPALRRPPAASIPIAEKPGDKVGRYKLLQQIGEGGCGVVYMAEQEEPVHRHVALKIIKLGMDTRNVIARFEAERQALAMMDHPNIAKVFDAGATETGRPYFVMELVRGMKITDYCDEAKLSIRARLDLFVQVCHTIQHAHQKGIIHRDIKPSNILVTVNDGVAVSKVIDFGIAKATGGQRLTGKTIFTAFEQFIGTPAYMSPEQAVLTSVDIDTRSDIYALGVLLYELLTGKTPFDAGDLLAAGLDELRRTIREQEPARPSMRLSTMPDNELSTTAQRRGLDAPKLVSQLCGDLDWIVMKCMEKDRARRYETAIGLARDIERHLKDEPVAARPPSNVYRFQKLVRRNKLVFAAVGTVVAALIVGLGLSIWFLMQARTAEKAAEARTIQVFEGATLVHAQYPVLTNEEVFFRSVLQLQTKVLGDESPKVVATMRDLATVLDYEDKQNEAEAELRQALALRIKIPGEQQPDAAAILDSLGLMLEQHGKGAEAEATFRRGVDWLRQNGTNNSSEAIKTRIMQNHLAGLDYYLGASQNGDASQNGLQIDEKSVAEASLGHWQSAATNLTWFIAVNPSNHWNWFLLAPILIQAGDLSGYRKESQAMLARFGETHDPEIAERTAKVCLLLPSAVTTQELATVGNLAERAVALGTNSPWKYWFQLTEGLAEYRQGQFSSSVETMQRIQKDFGAGGNSDDCEASSYMILAMGLQKLEKTQEARAALSQGLWIVHTKLPALNAKDLGPGWNDVVITYILMRQASEMIGGQPADGKEIKKMENTSYSIHLAAVSLAPLTAVNAVTNQYVGTGSNLTLPQPTGLRMNIGPVTVPEPVAGTAVTIQYVAIGRNLAHANPVYIHLGWNHWNPVVSPDVEMTLTTSKCWQYIVTVPANATILNFDFNDGQNTWDNNGGLNWNISVSTNSNSVGYKLF